MIFPRLAIFLSVCSFASATVITLAPSSQAVTFTGTGGGAAAISWGACNFNGTTTTCTVSGTYTGLGNGGTYQFVLQYGGNGPTPLSAISTTPGGDLVTFKLTAGTLTAQIIPSGGSPIQFYDLTFQVFFSASSDTCTGVQTCAVGSVGLSTGGTITGPINGTWDLTPTINAGGVVTATDYGGFSFISPATFVEIYGLNLATTLDVVWGSYFSGVNAPQTLGGTTATVGGLPAYVELASPHQVNVLVPSGLATGYQPVVVTTAGGASVATSVQVAAVAPGLLAPAAFKLAAGQYVFAQFPDNKTFALPPVAGLLTAIPVPGDVLIFYGLGFGPVIPNLPAGTLVEQANNLPDFQATIGGIAATVQFAGLVQGYTGLYQFNIVIPAGLPANNATPFTFSVGSTAGTQSLIIPIAN
jgi:uncharacterized protein (TIGR03437 family)